MHVSVHQGHSLLQLSLEECECVLPESFLEDNSVLSSLLTKPNNLSSDLLSATMIHGTGHEPIYREIAPSTSQFQRGFFNWIGRKLLNTRKKNYLRALV